MKLFDKDKNKVGKKKLFKPRAVKDSPAGSVAVAKTVKVKKNVIWSEMSNKELDKNYNSLKKELQELRFKKVISHVPDIRRIRFVKRSIARVLTCKRQRRIAIAGIPAL